MAGATFSSARATQTAADTTWPGAVCGRGSAPRLRGAITPRPLRTNAAPANAVAQPMNLKAQPTGDHRTDARHRCDEDDRQQRARVAAVDDDEQLGSHHATDDRPGYRDEDLRAPTGRRPRAQELRPPASRAGWPAWRHRARRRPTTCRPLPRRARPAAPTRCRPRRSPSRGRSAPSVSSSRRASGGGRWRGCRRHGGMAVAVHEHVDMGGAGACPRRPA